MLSARRPDRRCGSRPALILAFIYLPIGMIVLYSFNAARVATWPISGLTLDWYVKALANAGHPDALLDLGRGGDRGDDRRARPRHADRVRRPALLVLRPQTLASSSCCRWPCRASSPASP